MGLLKKLAIALFIGGLCSGYFLGYYINTDRRYRIQREDSIPFLVDKREKRRLEINEKFFVNAEKFNYNNLGDELFHRGLDKIKHEVGNSIDSLLGYKGK